jgi:hypothetical protein
LVGMPPRAAEMKLPVTMLDWSARAIGDRAGAPSTTAPAAPALRRSAARRDRSGTTTSCHPGAPMRGGY